MTSRFYKFKLKSIDDVIAGFYNFKLKSIDDVIAGIYNFIDNLGATDAF